MWGTLFALVAAQNPANGSLTGTILLSGGGPAPGVRVAAMTVQEGTAAQKEAPVFVSLTETDASGRYRLENIPPGRYYLTAGFLRQPTYYPGAVDLVHATAIAVTAGAALTGYDFSTIASIGVNLRGQVVMPSVPGMRPLPREVVLAGAPGLRTPLRADGSFEFERVPPGTYMLSALPSAGPGTRESIVVGDRDIDGIQIVIPNQIMVPLRVVTDDGSPLPNRDGTAIARSADFSAGTSVPEGHGFLRLFEGEHQISVAGFPPGYTLKSITYGSADIGLGPLRLDSAAQGDLVLTIAVTPLSSLDTVKVRGRIVNVARELNLADRAVRLTSSIPGGPTIETGLKADHSFEFANVPAGVYKTSLAGTIEGISLFPSVTVNRSDVAEVTIDLRNNPFPEFPGGSIALAFDDNNRVTVRGVVTQAVMKMRESAPARYFRMDVSDGATGVVTPWAVVFVRAGDRVKVTVGETVTVTGSGTRDGTHRINLDSNRLNMGSINGVPVLPAEP